MITKCTISMMFDADTPGDRGTPIVEIDGGDDQILEYVHRYREKLKKAVDAELWLFFSWRDQCNLAFEAETLSEISRHGLALCISCSEE